MNQNAPATSTGTGASWANAFRDLQSAIAATHPTSNNPAEIWVAKGVYYPTTGTNRAASFVLKSYLRILGGFKGDETNDTRYYYGYPTVLSGDIGSPQAKRFDTSNIEYTEAPFDAKDPGVLDNCYNVVTATNVVGVVLDKLYITGGFATVSTNVVDTVTMEGMAIATGPTNSDQAEVATMVVPLDPRVSGGGLFLVNTNGTPETDVSLILNNCVFKNNGARGYGGGVAAKWVYVQTYGTTFSGNYAGGEGGGYWSMNCRSDFLYSDFDTNVADGVGGGVVYQSAPTDGSVDPFGQSSPDYRKTVQNTIGATIVSVKLAPKLYRLATSSGEFASGGICAKLGKFLPNSPFESVAADTATEVAEKIGSRFGSAYAWVTLAVTVVDVVADIVTLAGGGNSKFVKDWTWFSANFNEYATPQGWLTMLLQVAGLIRGPTPKQLAEQVVDQQQGLYNQLPYSSMRACTFSGNVSGEEGGAYYCAYDNVQLEDCQFTGNVSADGGAVANFVWNTPIIVSCSFLQNTALDGQSAMVNGFHTRAQIMNCTFSDNSSGTAGYAVGNVMGADVVICNSIFWGNTNVISSNNVVGADIFTSVHTNLDASSLSNYTAGLSDGTRGDWVATCDVSFSCVQSLHQLPLGAPDYSISFPEGFSYPTQQQLDDYIAQWTATLRARDLAGLLDTYDYHNLGEGFLTNIFDASKGNIDSDPLLINGITPSRISPVIDHGNSSRLNNGIINSLTGADVALNDRLTGANIDMGAVEYAGGPDPSQLPGFPQPDVALNANVIYVTTNGAGAKTGLNWANATGNLAAAVTNSGYQVWVAAGTYYPTSTS
ncbi:MAG TPA: hypothetical protein VHB20_16685, partial [Verrucomicrobiae bacterium]|nr:hypothetical protein [Verrucomicrobiae bacterium]